ncbi:putative uncharacterized transposon-derived protein F52C9.6, partial [Stylophora pistillata]
MFNDHVNKSTITVDGKIIEEADSYVYLGKTLTRDGDPLPEIRRRIALGWAAFGKVDNIMRSRKARTRKIKRKIKRKIHDENILPVMTYGCETLVLNNARAEKPAVTQRKMERIMVSITVQKDHALLGHVMYTTVVVDEFECRLKCMGNNSCKSVNVYPGDSAGQRICELNNKTRQLKPSDLKREKGSTYCGSVQASCMDVSREQNRPAKSGQCHPGYQGTLCQT